MIEPVGQERRGKRRLRRVLYVIVAGVVVLSVSALASGMRRGQGGPRAFTDIASQEMADATRLSEGACWADYDGDGDQDLFVSNSDSASRLWRNDGGGSFTDVFEQALGIENVRQIRFFPRGCAFIDIDNDGDPDLYASARNRTTKRGSLENKLFRNNGNGTFTDITEASGVAMRGIGTASSDWIDLDKDGDLDGFVASRHGKKGRLNALFRQDDPLKFTDMGGSTGVGDPEGPQRAFLGSWFDYDADGDPDLILAIDFWGTELYRNDGGHFVRTTTTALPPATDKTPGAPPNNAMGVTWGDYDNDGCFDVFVTGVNVPGQSGFEEEALGDLASRLYKSTCKGAFTDVTVDVGFRPSGVVEWSANFVDYDNDGDLDLTVVAGNAQQDLPKQRVLALARRMFTLVVTIPRRYIPPHWAAWLYRYEAMIPASGNVGVAAGMPDYLYQNMLVEEGVPRFVDVTYHAGISDMGATRGSSWADFDNDGDLDWFVANRNTPNRLYRNNGPVGNHLRVHLIGDPLRDAVGSWVKITSAGRQQLRHVRVLDGYLSQSQLDPHFGLGAATTVEKIWVRWSGETRWVQLCSDVPANRTVTITQGGECRW